MQLDSVRPRDLVLFAVMCAIWGLTWIAIRAGVDNARSRAIPARLGFREEGVLRGEGKGSGGYYDLVVYGLLEDEWRGSAGGAGGTG